MADDTKRLSIMTSEIGDLLRSSSKEELGEVMKEMHPVDIADALFNLGIKEQVALISRIDRKKTIEVFNEIDEDDQVELLNNLEKELDYGIPKSEWKISQQEYMEFLENDFTDFYELLYNYMDTGDSDSKDLDKKIVKRYEKNVLKENYLKFIKISEDLIFIDFNKLDYELDRDNNSNAVNDEEYEEFLISLSGSSHTLNEYRKKYFESEEN